jgi:hypothetical protein
VVSTKFGTVTDLRVQLLIKKGWFGGERQEDIPLRHITSVSLETTRQLLASIAVGIVGGVLLLERVMDFRVVGGPSCEA